MYKALTRFADMQDAGRIYEAGDTYPRPGFEVTEQRLAELAGSDNRARRPLIQAAETPVEPAKDKPKEIPTEAQKPAQRARRGRKKEG